MDPRGYERYVVQLQCWRRRATKAGSPPDEQALVVFEGIQVAILHGQMKKHHPKDRGLDRYDCDTGLDTLLSDLKVCDQREDFQVADPVEQYENIKRQPGESYQMFILRMIAMEAELGAHRISEYPETSRALKLLNGLSLSEDRRQKSSTR